MRLRRAVDHPVAARGRSDIVEIAQRHLLAARHIQQASVRRPGRARSFPESPGPDRRADSPEMSCPIRCDTSAIALVGGEPALQARELLLRLLVALADDGHHARQDRHVVGRAPVLHDPLLQAVVGGLGRGRIAVDHGEDEVGGARRELLPGRRAAGLDDDGMPLRAALDVERALDAEEAPLVIERAHLRRVEEGAGRLVGNDGAVVPACPIARAPRRRTRLRSRSAGRAR